jgi:outer membrane protein OmpA-like peptidoglycan-associated protein
MAARKRDEQKNRSLAASLWASASYLLAALLMAALFAASVAQLGAKPAPVTPHPLIDTPTLALEEWSNALADLCSDPDLVAMDMHPDCATGIVQLPHKLFFEFKSSEVSADGKARLKGAMPIILEKLRAHEALWKNIDVIEVRGHADPRAARDHYAINLRQSQDRALEVLRFLTAEGTLETRDRRDLQRLAIASGASYTRPPEGCEIQSESEDCFDRWRRAELRIGMNDEMLREAQTELLGRVREFIPSR